MLRCLLHDDWWSGGKPCLALIFFFDLPCLWFHCIEGRPTLDMAHQEGNAFYGDIVFFLLYFPLATPLETSPSLAMDPRPPPLPTRPLPRASVFDGASNEMNFISPF